MSPRKFETNGPELVTDHGEQRLERVGQHVVGLGRLGRALGLHHRGPGLGDALEHALLVGGVALDRLDQVGDEVDPALELDVDLVPAVLHPVALHHQRVVGRDEEDDQHGHGGQDDDENRH